ncbi:MAG: DNA-binding domain-containing protein [Myxococcales bacterium]|nr:DNA-binding domain-containing protein [Myxococcales bacterium]
MNGAPQWLADYQAQFSRMLREPFTVSAGRLVPADPERFPASLCITAKAGPHAPGPTRLGTYNRQYWLRLITTMQRSFPLTVALLGPGSFNLAALGFLVQRPPRHRDLAAIANGFDGYVRKFRDAGGSASDADGVSASVAEAVTIDRAFNDVVAAPAEPTFAPGALGGLAADDLASARLLPSAAVRFVEESWPLLELRRRVLAKPRPEAPVALPPALAATRAWALQQREAGQVLYPLSPLQARLYTCLQTQTVGAALADLERVAGADGGLARSAEAWLALGVEHGFWRGISR